MKRLNPVLRDQNIRIAEEKGRSDLMFQPDADRKIMLTESDKEQLRRLLSGFAKKSLKKGGDGSRSISNNRATGREVAARINSGGQNGK